MSLQEKRLALVTGGTRGIGAAICKKLKSDGFDVVANYVGNHDAAEQFAEENGLYAYDWDVSDAKACEAGIARVVAEHGKIDVLVHNAGITKDRVLYKQCPQNWDDVIRTNLSSCFYLTRYLTESMRNNNYGRMVFISSVNALRGQFGQTNYCAAKAGMIGFAKALAHETAKKDITVNVVAPGYTDTEMLHSVGTTDLAQLMKLVPKDRLATAIEIADVVSFLVREESGFITGATFNINGGMYMQ